MPTVCRRQLAGRRRRSVCKISRSKPISPSVTKTIWRNASGRSETSAASMPDLISVPPPARRARSHDSASALCAASANTASRFQRRADEPNSISSKLSRSPRLCTSALVTLTAWASGSPCIEPLVSSKTIRSRATVDACALALGGLIVSRPNCVSSRRCPCETRAVSSRTPGTGVATPQRITTSRSSRALSMRSFRASSVFGNASTWLGELGR